MEQGHRGRRQAPRLFVLPEPQATWERGLARVVPLESDQHWDELRVSYEADRTEYTHNLLPWRRCLAVARAAGAVVAIVERRYICYDYGSEYSAFYSHVHANIPATAHRIHFFGLPIEESNYRELTDEQAQSYLGYIICRPRDLEIVGRTMLTPPPDIPVLTLVRDTVTFFGQKLTVRAVPFMQQDERLGVCGNIVAWIVHYAAYRRGQVNRRFVAEFRNRGVDLFHPKAAIGVGPQELVALLDAIGFRTEMAVGHPADVIPHTRYPWHEAIPDAPLTSQLKKTHAQQLPGSLRDLGDVNVMDIRRPLVEQCCRILNAGMPVIANALNHTVVVCGYQLVDNDRLAEFVVQDDQVGPYVLTLDCLFDRMDVREMQAPVDTGRVPERPELIEALSRPVEDPEWFDWIELLAPLPDKVFLPMHQAERASLRLLQHHFASSDNDVARGGEVPPELLNLRTARDHDSLRFRSYLVSANVFKENIVTRGAAADLAREYRSLRLSEWVVVVEFVDTSGPEAQHRCLGEVLFDATSNPKNPWVHALRLGTSVSLVHSDGSDRTVSVRQDSLAPGASCYRRLAGKLE